MRRSFLLAAVMLASAAASPALAASSESLGTDVAIALPVIAGGITLYKNDWMGTAQLTMDTDFPPTLSAGLQMAYLVNEERQINRKTAQLVITAFVQLNTSVGQIR